MRLMPYLLCAGVHAARRRVCGDRCPRVRRARSDISTTEAKSASSRKSITKMTKRRRRRQRQRAEESQPGGGGRLKGEKAANSLKGKTAWRLAKTWRRSIKKSAKNQQKAAS
jgi:hypothetical protein